MKQTLIAPFELGLLESIKDNGIIVLLDSLGQWNQAAEYVSGNRKVIGIVLRDANIDLSEALGFKYDKIALPVYVYCSFNGNKYEVLRSLENAKKYENVNYFVPLDEGGVWAAKVLSSSGVRSSVAVFESKDIDADLFLEAATYSILCPVPHTFIEPFGFLQSKTEKKAKYINLKEYFWSDPSYYLWLDREGKVHASYEDLKNGEILSESLSSLDVNVMEEISSKSKFDVFYSHFLNHSECEACPLMKICCGMFKNKFENCRDIMSELYNLIS